VEGQLQDAGGVPACCINSVGRSSPVAQFKRWTCEFTNQFTQQLVRTQRFSDPEKVRDIAQRGKALTDLSSKNNFEHAVRNGCGGVILELNDFQYDKLIGKDHGRTS
jgi:hypothetical protein